MGLPPGRTSGRRSGGRHWKFARGQLEVDEGEGRLDERGASQGWGCRVLHSAWPGDGCSFQNCHPSLHSYPLPGISWPPPLANHHRLSHLQPLVPPSCLAAPMALASAGGTLALGGWSASMELEGRVDRPPFGQFPVVTTHHPLSPITAPLPQGKSLWGPLYSWSFPGSSHSLGPPDQGRPYSQGPVWRCWCPGSSHWVSRSGHLLQ